MPELRVPHAEITRSSIEQIPPEITWLSLSRSALSQNIRLIERVLDGRTLCAVVKSDAYGHGVDLIVPELTALGVNTFALTHAADAVWIRQKYPTVRLLVMCDALSSIYDLVLRYGLEPVLNDRADLDYFAKKKDELIEHAIQFHFKVDTGMGRLGLMPDEFKHVFSSLSLPKGTRVGLMTHFSDSGNPAHPITRAQCSIFADIIAFAKNHHPSVEAHAANSAALLNDLLASETELCRVGIAMYGASANHNPYSHLFKSVMAWKSKVHHVRHVPAGQSVGYSHVWEATRDTRTAIIPVGYRFGYAIAHTGKSYVEVADKVVPVIGRISMDMSVVDVTDVPLKDDQLVGQEVTLLSNGADPHPENDIFALSKSANTIPYEIYCGIHTGISRVWSD